MTAPKHRRYPVEPLLHVFGELSTREIQRQTGIHYTTIQRWRNDPGILITEWEADRYAVKLGKHPSEFWSNWFDIDATAVRGRRKIA